MSRYISKYDDYSHEIHQGVTVQRIGMGGTFSNENVTPHLVARFQRGALLQSERTAAQRHFDNVDASEFSGEPAGPYRHDGVFVAADEDNGVGYSGSRREMFYSVFDTEDTMACPPEYREAFEAVLSGNFEECKRVSGVQNFMPPLRPSPDLGHTTLDVAKLPGVKPIATVAASSAPPWPSYDEIKGPGAPNKIFELATATSTQDLVIAYEPQHRNRPAVLAKFGVEAGAAPVAAPIRLEPDPDQMQADIAAAMSSVVPA